MYELDQLIFFSAKLVKLYADPARKSTCQEFPQ